MKKLSWILILILTVSLLSACGRKETVIYHEDTASISDAADNSIRTLDYSIPGDFGTLHVQAQVDTSLAAQNSPVATLSRNDFTDEDIDCESAVRREKLYPLCSLCISFNRRFICCMYCMGRTVQILRGFR